MESEIQGDTLDLGTMGVGRAVITPNLVFQVGQADPPWPANSSSALEPRHEPVGEPDPDRPSLSPSGKAKRRNDW